MTITGKGKLPPAFEIINIYAMSVFQIVWTTNSQQNKVPYCLLDESKITKLDVHNVDRYSETQPTDYQN